MDEADARKLGPEYFQRVDALGDRWAEVKDGLAEKLGPALSDELENVIKENIALAIEGSVREFMQTIEPGWKP